MWQIRQIIDGIARTDGFDTSDDAFSISLASRAVPGMTGGILNRGKMHFSLICSRKNNLNELIIQMGGLSNCRT